MAAIVEVRKGDTVRQMSEYSYMLLKYANGAREGWVYVRHVVGDAEGFDPSAPLNQVRPTGQTTAMATPFIPEEIKRTKPLQGTGNKAVAVTVETGPGPDDPNAGAKAVSLPVDPNAGTVEGAGSGTVDPNAGAEVKAQAAASNKAKSNKANQGDK